MHTKITEVKSETTPGGLEVTITVTRDWRVPTILMPAVSDVPQDIRDALSAWLKEG